MVVANEQASRIDSEMDAVDGASGVAVASCRGSVKSCVPNLFTKKLNAPTVKLKPDSRPENAS